MDNSRETSGPRRLRLKIGPPSSQRLKSPDASSVDERKRITGYDCEPITPISPVHALPTIIVTNDDTGEDSGDTLGLVSSYPSTRSQSSVSSAVSSALSSEVSSVASSGCSSDASTAASTRAGTPTLMPRKRKRRSHDTKSRKTGGTAHIRRDVPEKLRDWSDYAKSVKNRFGDTQLAEKADTFQRDVDELREQVEGIRANLREAGIPEETISRCLDQLCKPIAQCAI
ncbi:hypothetical protein BC832DRAFT_54961 [Gaertneriomyces semiglobifer]|nr:hypothetical protein BC832DRAFT_54961 [Gaertneriomyces semiglobifer]